jgi:hypothetical protein
MFEPCDIINRLIEGDEYDFDSDFLKDVADPDEPTLQPVSGAADGVVDVMLGDQWIGRMRRTGLDKWAPIWMPGNHIYQPSSFKTARECIDWFVQYWRTKPMESLITGLIEDEEFEDPDDVKDMAPNQLQAVTDALTGAGFKITRAELQGIKLVVGFSWPFTSATSYVNGFKRAQEVLRPIIPLRMGNYTVTKDGKTAHVLIVKTMEDDPGQWKVEPLQAAGNINANPVWFSVSFNGQPVGEAYLPAFTGSKDTAERLREEMAEIHLHYVHFNPSEWPNKQNAFGGGPALVWWSSNRDKLSTARAASAFFPHDLLNLKQ